MVSDIKAPAPINISGNNASLMYFVVAYRINNNANSLIIMINGGSGKAA